MFVLMETTPGGELLPAESFPRFAATYPEILELHRDLLIRNQDRLIEWWRVRNLLPDWFEYRSIASRFSIVEVYQLG